ncbi:uncharacterized protein LOC120194313 [Hibiscus syriacus]|uniref:uncharacterized protein LOC120194313 n=1 Tax=Hibiscus syriacus TaxID=106335 RepID=UPI001921D1F4|nr:uncharacterized protein LOC120194313 [Hibiscus syriacus]
MKLMIQEYIQQCEVCQRTKSEHISKPGLLQPIPIPHNAWEDFIEGLPPSAKHNCILVVIDKFTKYAHFIPLSHPYTVVQVAKIYLDQVYKLHGPPKVTISDRDKSFTILFWQELFKQLGTTTLFSTAYHPETDGQTERLNQCLEQYLRTLYGYKAPVLSWSGDSIVDAVGEEVYLKLQPYRQTSLALRRNLKLAARFFGPYKIQKKIGQVAYRLELPPESKLHPVFHVSLLKKKIGKPGLISLNPPETSSDGQLKIYPTVVLNSREITRQNQRVRQFLMQWTNMGTDDATWEDYTVLKNQFPDFDPWGQGSSGGGGIVMMEGRLGFDQRELGSNRGRKKGGNWLELKNEKELGIEASKGMGWGGLQEQADIIKPSAKWAQSSNDPDQSEVKETGQHVSPLGDIL